MMGWKWGQIQTKVEDSMKTIIFNRDIYPRRSYKSRLLDQGKREKNETVQESCHSLCIESNPKKNHHF